MPTPLGDFRFWPLADIGVCAAHVGFRGESGHDLLRRMSAFDPRRTSLRGEAKKPAPPRYDHHEFFSLMKWRGTLVFPRRSLGRVPWGADPTTARKVGVSCSACPLTRGDRH